MYGNPATSLAQDRDLLVVGLQDGSQARARAVVIATGVSYRRLGIPELEALAGAGVFYIRRIFLAVQPGDPHDSLPTP
ncbi:MAG: hypothetical protein ACRDPY_14440 [Streptosporangiaceae bacterium]